LIAHIGKAALAIIAENLILLRISHRVEEMYIVVEMAIGDEDIAITIVVVVEKERASG
jgi:hypothetical protein